MLNGNIEIRLISPNEGLTKKELKRVRKDLNLMEKIAFMIKGKSQDIKGVRRVYALHKKGGLSGYRIEDVKFIPSKFDPNILFSYSEGKKEITLEEIDEIRKTQKEHKSKPYPS